MKPSVIAVDSDSGSPDTPMVEIAVYVLCKLKLQFDR